MMKKQMIITAAAGAALLAGCAGAPDAAEYAEMQMEAQQVLAEAEEARKERESERIAERIESIPDWVIEPPPNGTTGIYAVGSARSIEPIMALRQARLKAEFALAQAIRQEVSGQERQFEFESMSGDVSGEYQLLVDRFVSAVPLKGHNLVDQVVYASQGEAQAHVLYRMSAEALRNALAAQSGTLQGMASATLFDALQQRVREATTVTAETTDEGVSPKENDEGASAGGGAPAARDEGSPETDLAGAAARAAAQL